MLKNQKIIATRKFLASFSKISDTENTDEDTIYFLIVKNGEEAGIYIPPNKLKSFFKIHSPFPIFDKTLIKTKEKHISLKDSFKKLRFKGEKNLSQEFKKNIYK